MSGAGYGNILHNIKSLVKNVETSGITGYFPPRYQPLLVKSFDEKMEPSLDPPQIQFQFNEKDKVIKYRLFSRYHAFLEGKLVEISDEITPAELKGAVRVKSEFLSRFFIQCFIQ